MNHQEQGSLFWEAHLYISAIAKVQIANFDKRALVLALLEEDASEILIQFPDIQPRIFFKLLKDLYQIKSADAFLNSAKDQSQFYKIVIQDDKGIIYNLPCCTINTVLKRQFNETYQERSQRLLEFATDVLDVIRLPEGEARQIRSALQAVTSQYYFLTGDDINEIIRQLVVQIKQVPGHVPLESIRINLPQGELTLQNNYTDNTIS